MPDRSQPLFRMPERDAGTAEAEALPAAQWIGGLAVRMVSPACRRGIRGVDSTPELADGGRQPSAPPFDTL